MDQAAIVTIIEKETIVLFSHDNFLVEAHASFSKQASRKDSQVFGNLSARRLKP